MPNPEFNTPEYQAVTDAAIERNPQLQTVEKTELDKAVDLLLGCYVKDNPVVFFYVNIIRHLDKKQIQMLKKMLREYSSTHKK